MSESASSPQPSDDSKKRTRVTPSQLTVLEETFNIGATPDSKMRKQLASRLQMPERSIQIWFQNRRAKVKMLQRRVLLRQEQDQARAVGYGNTYPNNISYNNRPYPHNNGSSKLHIPRAWSTDMISHSSNSHSSIPPPPPPPQHLLFNGNGNRYQPYSQMHPHHSHSRNYSQQQQHSSNTSHELDEDIYSLTISPSPTPQYFANSAVPRRMESEPIQAIPHHSSNNSMNTSTTTTTASGLNITATTVTVGTWHRMKLNQLDLVCCYEPNERSFSWHIRDSNYHFKMVISFDSIASIELQLSDDQVSAQIDMDLIKPPNFYMMDSDNFNSWVQCSDFTEGMQASINLRHSIRGLASDLHSELLSIADMDKELYRITRFPTAAANMSAASAAAMSATMFGMPPPLSTSSLSHVYQHHNSNGYNVQDDSSFLDDQNWRHQSVPLSWENY